MNKELDGFAQKLYNVLKSDHFGRDNGIRRPDLAKKLGITERGLRKLTQEINTNPRYEKLVSTTHSCYLCATKEECEESIRNTYRTAITLIKKGQQMAKKVGLNGQIKMPLGGDFSIIVETFSEVE